MNSETSRNFVVGSCIAQVGYTGDPYSGCVDIDECSDPGLNTCAGGLHPRGVDADLHLDNDNRYNFYLGEPGADGFTQVGPVIFRHYMRSSPEEPHLAARLVTFLGDF